MDVAGKRRLCSRGVRWGQVEGTELGAWASLKGGCVQRSRPGCLDLEDRKVGGVEEYRGQGVLEEE